MELRNSESTCSIQVLKCSSQDNSQTFSIRNLADLKWATGARGEENIDVEKKKLKRRGFSINEDQSALGFGDGTGGAVDDDIGSHHRHKRRIRRKNSDGEYEYEYVYDDSYDYDEDAEEIRNLSMEELQSSLFQGSPELLAKLLKKYQEMSALEKEQLAHWLNAVKYLILTQEEINNLSFMEDMKNHADSLIDKLKTPLTNLNFAIVGPRYSGKTTFLAIFLEKIAELLVSTGQWKKSFVCYLDFRDISQKAQNLFEFYQQIVNITFSQLERQIPELAPFSKRTIKFFSDLPSGKVAPSFPKRIAIDKEFPSADIKFTRLAQRLYSLFKDEDKLPQAVELVLTFPQEISSIFSLPCVHYIIDHFENSNIPILPSEINSSPKSKTNQGIIISTLKKTLVGKSFVICCQNEPTFLKILREIKGTSPEMKTKVVITNISDIVIAPDKKDESKRELHVSYKDGHSHIVLTRDKCQGCIGFIAKWNHLMKLAKSVEEEVALISKVSMKSRKGQPVKSQADIVLFDYVKSFLPQILSIKDLPQSEILDATVIDRHGK